jgi:NADH-quinone oxidoreductase subunit E
MQEGMIERSHPFRQNGISLISQLQQIQQEHGWLPEPELRRLSAATGEPLIEIYRVATFYKSFSLAPRGRHRVTACCGTACHVRGSAGVTREISKLLGVKPGGTSADGRYSLETVNCLGACALAPLVVVDGEYHGNITPAGTRKLLKKITGPEAGNGAAAER